MIIDSHIHCYDPERPQGIPWPPPDDSLLYRRVLPEHHRAIAGPLGVTGIVIVEASPRVEDNAWVLDLAENDPYVVGFVGNLDPGAEDFERNLNRFSANPLFRGIRLSGGHLRGTGEGVLVSGLEKLAARDLELDLLIDPEHLARAASLASQIPDLRIVVNHVSRVPIDGKTPPAVWLDGVEEIAKHPRIYCKVSALVQMAQDTPAPGELDYYLPVVDTLWEALGEDRLLYGSDWPVCEQAAPYGTVFRIAKEYFSAKGEEAAEKYFWRNSRAAYGWRERG